MAFVQDIFNQMDEVSLRLVSDNVSSVITSATPVVSVALALVLMYETASSLHNPYAEPLGNLVRKFMRWTVIIGIASLGGFYQTQIANAIIKAPDEFANVLILNNGHVNGTAIASSIDNAFMTGMKVVQQCWDNAGVFSGEGLSYLFLAALVLFAVTAICVVGTGIILVWKFILAIFLVIGPVAIFCLLFKGTSGLFNKWVSICIQSGLVTVFVSLTFTVCMAFFQKAINSLISQIDSYDFAVSIAEVVFVAVLSVLIMFMIMELSARFSDGIQTSFAPLVQQSVGYLGGSTNTSASSPSTSMGASGGSTGASTGAAAQEANVARGLARGSRAFGGSAGASTGAAGGSPSASSASITK